jgi:hypothetical protein
MRSSVTFSGVKSKSATATLTLHHPSPLVADVFIGTCPLRLAEFDLMDQTEKTFWISLQGAPGQNGANSEERVSYGKVRRQNLSSFFKSNRFLCVHLMLSWNRSVSPCCLNTIVCCAYSEMLPH